MAAADFSHVADNLKQMRSKIEAIALQHGRAKEDVPHLLAVSKTKPADAVRAAYECGQRHFGENYVQELVEKAPLLPGDIKWHMIGHLQSNKVKMLLDIPNLHVIESVDSVKLADKINSAAGAVGRRMRVLVEVKTSDEESKTGVSSEDDARALIKHIVTACPHLELGGLMTVGHPDESKATECFQALRALRDSVSSELCGGAPLELSMGMTGDMEQAIACGSTELRIGTAVFGARDYGQKAQTQQQQAPQ